jgi:hypothetical protein
MVFMHEGKVEDDEFLSTYRAAYENPEYDMGSNMLIDLRRADSTPRSSQALVELARIVRRYYEDSPSQQNVAVVVSHDLSYRLARSYEVFSCTIPWAFNVFQDLPSALKWLGAPENLLDDPQIRVKPATSNRISEPHK